MSRTNGMNQTSGTNRTNRANLINGQSVPERIDGRVLDALDSETLGTAVLDLLGPHLRGRERVETVLIVPDTHYPYHPSTGLVTNPTVVDAVVDAVYASHELASVSIYCAGSDRARARDVASWLGYDAIGSRLGATLHYPDEVAMQSRTARVDGRRIELSVPRQFEQSLVILVPTLSDAPTHRVAAGSLGLARAALGREPTTDEIIAVREVCDPFVTLLDGTYCYPGEPRASRFLLAGTDLVAVDSLAADLFGLDAGDVPYLDEDGDFTSPVVDDALLDSIRDRLPTRRRSVVSSMTPSLPPTDVLARGYRLYARVSGDLIPPQLLAEVEQ